MTRMTEHTFGGDWTEIKLSTLQKYLNAYRQIFTQNPRARYLKTWYVDAFAGTGTRTARKVVRESALFADVYEDKETTQYQAGSAKIALSLAEPFDRYLFIDKSNAHVAALRQTIGSEYSALLPRCEFRQGDANSELKAWCKERNWRQERAVVFLDPYGMQVEWSTVQALAATQAVDLWYLFPLGVGVARLLMHQATSPNRGKRNWIPFSARTPGARSFTA